MARTVTGDTARRPGSFFGTSGEFLAQPPGAPRGAARRTEDGRGDCSATVGGFRRSAAAGSAAPDDFLSTKKRRAEALLRPGRPPSGPSLGTTSGKKSETINQERSGKISSAQVSIETGQLQPGAPRPTPLDKWSSLCHGMPSSAACGRLMPRFATFSRRFHRPIHGTFTVFPEERRHASSSTSTVAATA